MINRRTILGFVLAIVTCAAMSFGNTSGALAANNGKSFTLAVSDYTGWMPWYYAQDTGILSKWADKYGITINFKKMDYVSSLEAYASGDADAVVVTNMEALDLAASRSVDTSVVIMGDYSNGNDAVLTRRLRLEDLRGQSVMLTKGTVSQYLLSRALQKGGMTEADISMDHKSDGEILQKFLGDQQNKVVVTWNPFVMAIMKNVGIRKVFDSSQIPGEIQDLLVVNTAVLKDNPDLARALTGAWYEVMDLLTQHGNVAEEALTKMADLAQVSLPEFKGQMRTTAMFFSPALAADYTRSVDLKSKTDLVRNFCFAAGLFGPGASSVDAVGIQFPDGTVRGDKNNIKFRYVSTYMEAAAAGKL